MLGIGALLDLPGHREQKQPVGESASLRGVLLDAASQQEGGLNDLLCCLSRIAIINVIFMLHFAWASRGIPLLRKWVLEILLRRCSVQFIYCKVLLGYQLKSISASKECLSHLWQFLQACNSWHLCEISCVSLLR